ncbi:MAG: ArsB/NhaD family transporter, partial [Candidatus Omnitrophica bacterium]|nr:ArsB/NhaD family transporter [Candidatus Omnitrophota bacterium]
LFIVMKGIEKTGITGIMFDQVRHFIYGAKFVQIAGVSWVSALTSNVISNVPAVILFSNVFSGVAVPQTIWLALAMSSTLAGNLTIIGSIANIIVFESARDDTQVGFFEYFKVGLPITLVTMAIGIFVLIWRP